MSPVDLKKWPCRPVEFKGQGPLYGREVPTYTDMIGCD